MMILSGRKETAIRDSFATEVPTFVPKYRKNSDTLVYVRAYMHVRIYIYAKLLPYCSSDGFA